MISCQRAQSLLSRCLDEELPPREVERLDRHLERCADCRQVQVDFEVSDGALRRLLPLHQGPEDTFEDEFRLRCSETAHVPDSTRVQALLGRVAALVTVAAMIGVLAYLANPSIRRVLVGPTGGPRDAATPPSTVGPVSDDGLPPAEEVAEAILLLEENRNDLRYFSAPDRPRLPVEMHWSRVVLTDSPRHDDGERPLEVFVELERVNAQLASFTERGWR